MSISLESSSPCAIRSRQSCSSSRVRARGKEPVFPARRRVKNRPFSVNNSHAVHMDTTSTQTVCSGGVSILKVRRYAVLSEDCTYIPMAGGTVMEKCGGGGIGTVPNTPAHFQALFQDAIASLYKSMQSLSTSSP